MRNRITTANFILAIGLILLAGCGQTGPLYPPDESRVPQSQTERSSSID